MNVVIYHLISQWCTLCTADKWANGADLTYWLSLLDTQLLRFQGIIALSRDLGANLRARGDMGSRFPCSVFCICLLTDMNQISEDTFE